MAREWTPGERGEANGQPTFPERNRKLQSPARVRPIWRLLSNIACNHLRAFPNPASLENLEEVVTCGSVERLETPVIEDKELHAAERPLDAGIATTAGERKVGKQLGDALVEDGAIIAACL